MRSASFGTHDLYDAKASVTRGSVVADGGAIPALFGFLHSSVALLPISSWANWLKKVSRASTDSFRMQPRSFIAFNAFVFSRISDLASRKRASAGLLRTK